MKHKEGDKRIEMKVHTIEVVVCGKVEVELSIQVNIYSTT